MVLHGGHFSSSQACFTASTTLLILCSSASAAASLALFHDSSNGPGIPSPGNPYPGCVRPGGAKLASNKELARRLDALEARIEKKLTTHDQAIAAMLSAIRHLLNPPRPKRRPIGFTADLEEKA
jgi:hypothetical protein